MENDVLKSNGQSNLRPEASNKIKRFSNEGIFMSVSKKAEKITTALYMLSDLISENDPMRHRIRTVSLRILSDTRNLSYALTGDLYFHLGQIIAFTWEVVSLIEISANVGFISDMNSTVMKNALIEFIGDLRNRQRIEGFKSVEELKGATVDSSGFGLKAEFFKLSDEDLLQIDEEKGYRNQNDTVKDIDTYKRQSNVLYKKSPSVSSVPDKNPLAMKERQAKILELIKEKIDISINDIISHFSEYGKKTLQRDLAFLIESGAIIRQGDKRWSRYSLKV